MEEFGEGALGLTGILFQAPVFLTLLDLMGVILWSSRWAWGYGTSSLGARSDDMIHPDDVPGWRLARVRAGDLSEMVRGVVRLLVPASGSHVSIEYRMAPYRDGAGQVTGILVASWPVDSLPVAAPVLPCLSPTEAKIVEYLRSEKGPKKGAVIAMAIGEGSSGGVSTRLKIILGNMVDRGLLLSNHDGYALAPAVGATSVQPNSS